MLSGSVSAEKQRIAEEVASLLKLNVEIDTTPSERLANLIPSRIGLCLSIIFVLWGF